MNRQEDPNPAYQYQNALNFSYTLFANRWNLISIPLTPIDTSIAAVLGTGVRAVWQYDASTGRYTMPTSIEPGKGYWVWVNNTTERSITGSPVPDTFTLTLYPGWNLIGSYINLNTVRNRLELSLGNNVYTLNQAVSQGLISRAIYSYDGSRYVNELNDADGFNRGKGYFIRNLSHNQLTLSTVRTFGWQSPTSGTVSCPTGCTANCALPYHTTIKPHKGVDIYNGRGTPVLSAWEGFVRYKGWRETRTRLPDAYGRQVELEHTRWWSGQGYIRWTRYAHLDSIPINLNVGANIRSQHPIGTMGNTGVSTGVHLHWEIRNGQSYSAGWYHIPLNPNQSVLANQMIWVDDRFPTLTKMTLGGEETWDEPSP
ncbi:MAG: Murein DD-endopeptidase MepM [candidate division WS2 bacterium]|nr:Murein DD-endopeptidase MepM [Candidatus Psychracetigena formicireducens]